MRHCKKESSAWQWFERADQLPADWDKQLPAAHFLCRNSLSLHEGTLLPHIGYLYAITRLPNNQLLQCAFQVLRIGKEHVSTTDLTWLQRTSWNIFRVTARPKLLVAGHLFRHDVCSLHFTEDLSPFQAFQLYQSAIESALKKTGAGAVLVKDTPDSFISYYANYAPEFLMLRNDISMRMDLKEEWTTLKDYEKGLKHKYAQRLRKVRTAFDEIRIEELDEKKTFEKKAELYSLYRQVSDHQPVRLGGLSEEFIPLLKQHFKDELRVWAFYEGEKMIAFGSAWVYSERFDMFYIGFDYARNSELQLYFNILFFSVEKAIEFSKKELVLGRTALEAKARIGCRPDYLSTFLYIRNPLIRNIVARGQQRFLKMEGEWENRHPFK